MFEHFRAAWDELTAPGAPFAMHEEEVLGVPMRVYDAAPPNMRVLWEATAAHGDTPYLVYEDERYSYADIHARVRALAHQLTETFGVGPGDRVAVSMRNYPEWVISYWATISVGAALVGMNAWWTGPEMAYALRDSAPTVLVVDRERLERVVPLLDELRAENPLELVVVRHDEIPAGAHRWDDLVDPAAAPDTLPPAEIAPDDDATIFYTSGTTGFPKGAQLTHRGSVHNLLNLAFLNTCVAVANQKARAAGDQPADDAEASEQLQPAVLLPVPLFHVTGCNCVLHPATAVGGRVVLMYKWDAGKALEIIERERITTFTGVPTMSRELLMHPRWAETDTSSLESMGGGGAPLQPDLVHKIDQNLDKGRPSTGYGLTETHGIITAVSADLFVHKPESAGPVVPVMDAEIRDDEGNHLDVGELGELWVKGPNVIKGYLNRPEATAESIVDGWFRTGDIAFIDDDGFVNIRDRAKDMVLRGGENVYCAEVEAAIYEHPAVAEAAVFGIPDERLGEEVAVAIVCAPGHSLTEEELAEHLAPRLAPFKHPRHVWFLDEPLPRNANGKFVKRELREKLLAGR
ncbi:MAG: AMP-dependent synthetase [Actinomyces sp.]|nr:MAG: AMP-dependent synthetase [Actinomyces sp.]